MIEVQKAQELMEKVPLALPVESVELVDAVGRVLAEDCHADRQGPPFDRVAMDGLAVALSALQAGWRTFQVEGMQAAGAPRMSLKIRENSLEVMTGAMLPGHCDVVIPFESLERTGEGYVVHDAETIELMQNVHRAGSDYRQGEILLSRHTILNETHVAVAATEGCGRLKVVQRPKVALITTGSELVEVHESPLEHQIRKSNIYSAHAALKKTFGLSPAMFHIQDDLHETEQRLGRILADHDILILSGGVSKGKLDFVPAALEQIGVEKIFHKIAQKPGKPMWFGARGEKRVFALPGNPVSLMVCLHRYVLPYLRCCMTGAWPRRHRVVVDGKVRGRGGQTLFLPVHVHQAPDGTPRARVVQNNGSGDFAALTKADGFIEVWPDMQECQPGQAFDYYAWGDPT